MSPVPSTSFWVMRLQVYGEVRDLGRPHHIDREVQEADDADALDSRTVARSQDLHEDVCLVPRPLWNGGKIGPDLTGSNRANLDYILLNSVDPSYDVPEGYKMVVIQTEDGRVINGVIAEEEINVVVLKTVEQPRS